MLGRVSKTPVMDSVCMGVPFIEHLTGFWDWSFWTLPLWTHPAKKEKNCCPFKDINQPILFRQSALPWRKVMTWFSSCFTRCKSFLIFFWKGMLKLIWKGKWKSFLEVQFISQKESESYFCKGKWKFFPNPGGRDSHRSDPYSHRLWWGQYICVNCSSFYDGDDVSDIVIHGCFHS